MKNEKVKFISFTFAVSGFCLQLVACDVQLVSPFTIDHSRFII